MTRMAIFASPRLHPSLQHEWEAWPKLLFCPPALLSMGKPHLVFSITWHFSDPPAVMEGGEGRGVKELSVKVPGQA